MYLFVVGRGGRAGKVGLAELIITFKFSLVGRIATGDTSCANLLFEDPTGWLELGESNATQAVNKQ